MILAAVADNVASEASKTSAELQGLIATKATPSTTTSTGQPLTRMLPALLDGIFDC
jgi:hypothetical protein